MKRIRIVGLCVAALFAISAFAASSAFALPEYGDCIAKAGTGKYKNSNCTEKAGTKTEEKKFEFVKWIPNAKGEEAKETEANLGGETDSGGKAFLSTEHGTVIECLKNTGVGNIDVDYSATTHKQTPGKEVEHVVTTFQECKEAGKNCKNQGTNEIVTEELYGPLGYISGKGSKTPSLGQELKPEKNTVKNPKKRFAIFTCEEIGTVEVGEGTGKGKDCIIAPLTSEVNVESSEGTLFFSGEEVGEIRKQTPTHFEGKTTECNLETKLGEGGWQHSVQNGTEGIKFETALEIKA